MTCGFGHRDAEPVCMIVHSRSLLYAIESKIRRKEHGQVGISSRFRSGCASFLVLSGISIASPVHAISSEWFQHDHGAVRLVSATTVPSEAGLLELGLQFRMKPGWKIYWRSPGDAGFPPHIDWTGSENLAGARIHWPAPMRFSVLGLQTLGYQDQVVFPISAEVFAPERGVSLKAGLRFLTCDDICVPYQTTLNLALPAAPELDTPMAGLIEKWKQRVPGPEARGGLAIDRVESAVSGTDSFLLIRAVSATPFEAPDLFVEGPEAWNFARPDTHLEPDGKAVLMRIDVSGPDESEPRLVGQTLVATLVDGDRAIEQEVTVLKGGVVPQAPGPPVSETSILGLVAILGLALLGGLILNVMPCVLPVLSIKLLSIVEQGGESKSRIRANFVASAAGIITCFLILGTVAVGLRSAGLAAGWGIQFQQPVFVTLMLVMITLFACNMSGLFEFRLPGMIMDAAATRDTGSGLSGHFLSGVLATLLATPCTAPFLGTSIGFALMRGPLEIYAVFLALGTGLALPWLVVAVFPALVKRLPQPGKWMLTVRRILAFALVGTAVWLLSILWFQIGGPASSLIALIIAAIIFLLWQGRSIGEAPGFATWAVVAVLTVMSMVGAGSFSDAAGVYENETEDTRWIRFDQNVISAEVAAGKTVLVDVTADWCLTCQVNKSLVLNRGQVSSLLENGAVIGMRADWTRPNPEISRYLRLFDRFGIPFNVVYGPDSPHGHPLPEILTEAAVLDGIRTAGGRASQSLR